MPMIALARVLPGLSLAPALWLASACTTMPVQTLVTIADARSSPAEVIDIGPPGDSPGDLVVFDQPLLNREGETIGNNAGLCVRTRAGHAYQCQWTLTLEGGTLQVAGREFDQGTSMISIVGGTGRYATARGEMQSTNNGDGTFTQILYLY